MKIPPSPSRLSVIELLATALGLRLFAVPSTSVAVGLVALAGAWALEKIFVFHTRAYQNSLIETRDAAAKSAESAESAKALVATLESRLTRLENKEGFRRG